MADSTAFELRDHQIQASTFAVDNSGRFVLLGSRRCLAVLLVAQDDSITLQKKYSRSGKWEVGTCIWSPQMDNSDMFAVTSNEKVEFYSLKRDGITYLHSIAAHSRLISDMDWSYCQPNLIVTSSVDECIYTWDLRAWKKPALSFSQSAGASQVKLCRQLDNCLASSLDGDVRVWDMRKVSAPACSISAHLSKIHCLDWSFGDAEGPLLATASQDCTVKIWDFKKQSSYPVSTIATPATPMWRAKFTPFGRGGIVLTAMPQVRRGDNSLALYNVANLSNPFLAHSCLGHADVVLDMKWRQCSAVTSSTSGARAWQLMSLSKDQTLRLWQMGAKFRECQTSLSESQSASRFADISDALAPPSPREEKPSVVKRSESFQFNILHEFDALSKINIPGVAIEELNAKERSVTISCVHRKQVVRLTIFCADLQDNAQSPSPFSFQFSHDTNLSSGARTNILKSLHELCRQYSLSSPGTCLELCIQSFRTFVAQFAVGTPVGDADSPLSKAPPMDDHKTLRMVSPLDQYVPSAATSFRDAFVPFPRTSGARFASVGILVCFGRLITEQGESGSIHAGTTPRSMSALHISANGPPNQPGQRGHELSVSAFYMKKTSKRKGLAAQLHQKAARAKFSDVFVYDVEDLMPLNRELGKNYSVSGESVEVVCNKNALCAAAANRKDLVKMWTVIGQVAATNLKPMLCPDVETPWTMHPFGRRLVEA